MSYFKSDDLLSLPATESTTFNATAIFKTKKGNFSLADDILFIFNIIIGSIGLVGNVFVIIVIIFFTSMHKQLANHFVINQSIIDAVSSLFVIADYISSKSRIAPTLIPNEFASEFYCRVWYNQVLLWGSYLSSTYNLVVLTIERYMKIVHPIFHKNSFSSLKSKLLIVFVWLFGVSFQALYTIPPTRIVNGRCRTVSFWPNDATQQIVAYVIIIVQYFLPLVVFIVAYTKTIRQFLRRAKIHNEQGNYMHVYV